MKLHVQLGLIFPVKVIDTFFAELPASEAVYTIAYNDHFQTRLPFNKLRPSS